MPPRFLLEMPYGEAGLDLERAADEGRLTLRFRNAAGATVAERDAWPPPTLIFEHSDGAGGMGWSSAPLPLDISQDVPEDAASVELLSDGVTIAQANTPVMAAGAIPPPHRSEAIRDGSGWHLRIISERFPSADRFFAACRDLVARMKEVRPFDRTELNWRVTAHFWPSSGPGGLFQTFDPPPNDRRVFGRDQVLAKAFLDSRGDRDMGLVLVDSTRRGGAGGVGEFWPSWSTIVNEPGETWQDVTLHELGHAFGLADEYEQSDLTTDEPVPLERNVAKGFSSLPAPWAAMINVPPPPPTSGLAQPPGGWPVGTVGTFKGARYRGDRFRPSPRCRMRLANDEFCPVCAALIAAELT